MKKLALIVFGIALTAASIYAATLQTAGNQEAAKMGNSSLVAIVNANDVALNAELARAMTNITFQRMVDLPVTNVVLITNLVYDATGAACSNAAGAALYVVTGVTKQYGTVLPITNVVIQRR